MYLEIKHVMQLVMQYVMQLVMQLVMQYVMQHTYVYVTKQKFTDEDDIKWKTT